MFDRALFKANAKSGLKRYYWTAFLVSLVVGLVTGVGGGASARGSSNNANAIVNGGGSEVAQSGMESGLANVQNTISEIMEDPSTAGIVIGVFAGAVILALIFGLVWSLFVATPATIGKNHFYLASRESESKFNQVFYAFKNNYAKKSWASFSTQLIILAWSLLGVIPSILAAVLIATTESTAWSALTVLTIPAMIPALIKSFEYSQVDYLLAENKDMTGKRARELSSQMTDGYKWELFKLGFSFIGWILLSVLTCGIGVLFLAPYMEATMAEAYTFLKVNALNKNQTTIEELPGFAYQQM